VNILAEKIKPPTRSAFLKSNEDEEMEAEWVEKLPLTTSTSSPVLIEQIISISTSSEPSSSEPSSTQFVGEILTTLSNLPQYITTAQPKTSTSSSTPPTETAEFDETTTKSSVKRAFSVLKPYLPQYPCISLFYSAPSTASTNEKQRNELIDGMTTTISHAITERRNHVCTIGVAVLIIAMIVSISAIVYVIVLVVKSYRNQYSIQHE
jgi:hypothetical protein